MKALTIATPKGDAAKTTTCLGIAAAAEGHTVAPVVGGPQAALGQVPAAEPVEIDLAERRMAWLTPIRGGCSLQFANPRHRGALFQRKNMDADAWVIDPPLRKIGRVGAALLPGVRGRRTLTPNPRFRGYAGPLSNAGCGQILLEPTAGELLGSGQEDASGHGARRAATSFPFVAALFRIM